MAAPLGWGERFYLCLGYGRLWEGAGSSVSLTMAQKDTIMLTTAEMHMDNVIFVLNAYSDTYIGILIYIYLRKVDRSYYEIN